MVVGVATEAQGTGIGRAFLRPMIDIVVVFSAMGDSIGIHGKLLAQLAA
jgi:hypothetical protein